MKIVAAGGGTAGHLFPLLAVLEELSLRIEIDVLFFAVADKIDERIVPREHPSYRISKVRVRGLKRPLYSPENVKRFLDYSREFLKIKKEISTFKPDIAILTGGYISAVVGAAVPGKVPLFIHEQNVIPGLANRSLFGKAKRIFLSFEESLDHVPKRYHRKCTVLGNPVRDIGYTKSNLEIPDGVVLVLGGSLGSEYINSLMERVYSLDTKNVYVHSTGDKHWTERLRDFDNVVAMDFIGNMPALWRKAKMVVSRAGASTIAEMLYHRVGGILIPWRGSAESHQMENARAAAKRLNVLVFEEGKIQPEDIVAEANTRVYHMRSPEVNPSKGFVDAVMEEIT